EPALFRRRLKRKRQEPCYFIDRSIIDKSIILSRRRIDWQVRHKPMKEERNAALRAWTLQPGPRAESDKRAAAFYTTVDVDQGAEQALDLVERHGIGAVGQGLVGVGMGFHEKACHADGDGGTREHRHKLALAARTGALSAGQL